MATASEKQVDYIITLANQLTGRAVAHLSGVQDVLPISKTAATRGTLTGAEASACIDHLKAAIAAKPATGAASAPVKPARKRKTLAIDGAPTPEQVVAAMLSGHLVDIVSAKTGKTYRTAIEGIRREGDAIRVLTVDHRPGSIGLDNIASWTVLA